MSDTIEARIERSAARLSELTGIKFTYGYLGNDHGSDTSGRRYYLFAAHPGRAGTDSDRIGGVADPADLLAYLAGALALARVMAEPRQRISAAEIAEPLATARPIARTYSFARQYGGTVEVAR